MERTTLSTTIKDQTIRALWEVKNIIDCVPSELWNKPYCGISCNRHIYHMLHSLDLWFINPRDKNYIEPKIHEPKLNDLDVQLIRTLMKEEILEYYNQIKVAHCKMKLN